MSLELNNSGFSDALVILGAAGLVIPAFARFRISPVIGFILVGLLVGPSGLGALVADHPWLYYFTISDPQSIEPFAELGIMLLLFSIGLELSLPAPVGRCGTLVFGVGAAELLVAGAIIGVALHFLGQEAGRARSGSGIALALSSTALVLPIAGTDEPGRARPRSRCCCSRIWRWCRSSSCSARWRPTADDGWSGYRAASRARAR